MRVLFSVFALLFSLAFEAAASVRVISPVAGRWANRQPLVLDIGDDEECFYSFTSSNPLDSGFAYDGPVLIDVGGDVKLRIVCFGRDGSREEFAVDYTVASEPSSFSSGIERDFFEKVASAGVVPVSGGEKLEIPATLSYCIGDGDMPFIPGKTISVSEPNALSRYVPCTVSSASASCRFVIFVVGSGAGTFARLSVPFSVEDWKWISFGDRSQIWRIDDGMWMKAGTGEKIEVDRSVPHFVEWQSVEYEAGNPVQRFVLPELPSVSVGYSTDGVRFSLVGDARYRMGIFDSGIAGTVSDGGSFTSVVFDTFSGDDISADAVFSVFCDGVYQGTLSSPFSLDKRPPLPPVFSPSEGGSYARSSVELSVLAEDGADVFCSVAEFSADESENSSGAEEFVPYSGPIPLPSHGERVVRYKVRAYARDKSGNAGGISEYGVTVDEFNYYVSASAPDSARDGSRGRPFGSVAEMADVLKKHRFAHFYVSGMVPFPDGETVFPSNCTITAAESGSGFSMGDGAFLTVRSASLEVEGCVFEKKAEGGAESDSKRMFVLENAGVSFDGTEIVGHFPLDGTVLTAMNSLVVFRNAGVTVQSSEYGCAVSALSSKIFCESSRFASVSGIAVVFSVQGGSFDMRSSSCRVVGRRGRIAELSGSDAKIRGNSFSAEFTARKGGILPVWKDDSTVLSDEGGNFSEGF